MRSKMCVNFDEEGEQQLRKKIYVSLQVQMFEVKKPYGIHGKNIQSYNLNN